MPSGKQLLTVTGCKAQFTDAFDAKVCAGVDRVLHEPGVLEVERAETVGPQRCERPLQGRPARSFEHLLLRAGDFVARVDEMHFDASHSLFLIAFEFGDHSAMFI